jgi:hypothetical protein
VDTSTARHLFALSDLSGSAVCRCGCGAGFVRVAERLESWLARDEADELVDVLVHDDSNTSPNRAVGNTARGRAINIEHTTL